MYELVDSLDVCGLQHVKQSEHPSISKIAVSISVGTMKTRLTS